MARIVIPDDELNAFDLPPVCVITGATQGVVFKPVKFSWYPRWIAVLILVNVLLMAIVARVMTRTVKGELPFTEEGFAAWRRGRVLQVVSILGMFVLGFGSVPAFANDLPELGCIVLALAIALPIGISIAFVKGRRIVCSRIADGSTTLDIPSDAAAFAILEHLRGGATLPARSLSTALPTATVGG